MYCMWARKKIGRCFNKCSQRWKHPCSNHTGPTVPQSHNPLPSSPPANSRGVSNQQCKLLKGCNIANSETVKITSYHETSLIQICILFCVLAEFCKKTPSGCKILNIESKIWKYFWSRVGRGCVTFSGKIKRFSADHSPEPVMAKLRCSVIGRAVGRPVIGWRDLCYRPCYRPSFL